MQIGMIGLGLLGSAIAERLLLAGHTVVGFDLSDVCRSRLDELGGQSVTSAAAVIQACRTVVLSLPDSRIVRQVLQSAEGDFQDHLIIDTTTGDPQDTDRMAAELAGRGVLYADATIAGSSEQTRRGDVVVMAGGTPDAWRQALPVLTCFSSRQFHTGPCGSGATAKLIVNLVLGLNRAVLAEGLHLASQCGVDLPQILEILKSGAAYSRVMDIKGEKMIAGEFSPQARLNQHWKDVGLILDLGRRHAASLPLSHCHEQLLHRASDLGFGELDNSAIIRAFDQESRACSIGLPAEPD